MLVRRPVTVFCLLALISAAPAFAAGSGGASWAAPEIKQVTQAGVLGSSPATFAPQTPLTQGQLATALKQADAVLHPPAPPAPPAPPLTIVSTVPANATIAGLVDWEVDAPGQTVTQVDFAVDGTGVASAQSVPFAYSFDTTKLADGTHTLAINVALAGGGRAICVWTVTVANAPGAVFTPPLLAPVAVPIAKSSIPAPTPTPAVQAAPRVLYQANAPSQPVSIKDLDAALVDYLGLAGAAREIQTTLARAGLSPPPRTGTEAVARMLDLRLNHPANQDYLEILPSQPATRAEAAWSFAQLLHTSSSVTDAVQQAADAFSLPTFSTWQQRILTTAIHYVGYPYVWGGTSPGPETEFGVHSAGGFDCSGFVWRVYKLTSYPDEGNLANVIRGRTTYVMSGEVPHRELLPASKLQPGDVMFFGAQGPRSSPSEVDHTAIYLGNGWFVQSSDEGVTLLPFSGWYQQSFAWARRPLREAGLTG